MSRRSPFQLLFLLPRFLILFFLMLEVALKNGVAGENVTCLHSSINSFSHLEHSILIAGVDNHVEHLSVRKFSCFVFTSGDYLKQLIGAE